MQVTLLRPSNILGPGVRNTLSLMLRRAWAPVILGYAPMMQFLHVEDMAEALVRVLRTPQSGVFNVASDDGMPYPAAAHACGCRRLPMWPSDRLTLLLSRLLGTSSPLPPYLMRYLQYPVMIDGARFREHYHWTPRHRLDDLFAHYRRSKKL